MGKRTKIVMLCGSLDKARDEFLEWASVLEEHLGTKAKVHTYEKRIETPYVIMDFSPDTAEGCEESQKQSVKGYSVVASVEKANEQNDENILRLAIGEDTKRGDKEYERE